MSLLKTMMKYTGGEQEISAGSDEFSSLPPQPALYVSTSLDIRQIDAARLYPTDIEIESIRLRRLDPDYFPGCALGWYQLRLPIKPENSQIQPERPFAVISTVCRKWPLKCLAKKPSKRHYATSTRNPTPHPYPRGMNPRVPPNQSEKTGFIPPAKLGSAGRK